MFSDKLYSKNGLAAKKIAAAFMKINTGTRIPRIVDFCDALEIGRGTAQQSLKLLEEINAIRVESKGHLGSYLTYKDDDLLREISGVSSLIGAMPLPYSQKYEGLATAIVTESERMNNPINMAFVRGSLNRIKALKRGRYDFAIMSKMVAEVTCREDDTLEIPMIFGEKTYVSGHKLFFADPTKRKIEAGMVVGIDSESIDQVRLTEAECQQKDVTYLEVDYMQIPELLASHKIDAATLSDDERLMQERIGYEFTTEQANKLSMETTSAAIVIQKNHQNVVEQLSYFDVLKLMEIQKGVENKEIIPHY